VTNLATPLWTVQEETLHAEDQPLEGLTMTQNGDDTGEVIGVESSTVSGFLLRGERLLDWIRGEEETRTGTRTKTRTRV